MKRKLSLLWFAIFSVFVLVTCAQPASTPRQVHVNLPDDVPVLDGALDLLIDTIDLDTSVNYRFRSSDLSFVLDYYELALASAGWVPGAASDIVVDDAATLVRVNGAGDTITLNLTRNESGGSVLVDLDVERAE